MLAQAPGDREIPAQKLNISPRQIEYVTQSEAGEELILYGGTILPIENKFPERSTLYKIMSTRLSESVS